MSEKRLANTRKVYDDPIPTTNKPCFTKEQEDWILDHINAAISSYDWGIQRYADRKFQPVYCGNDIKVNT